MNLDMISYFDAAQLEIEPRFANGGINASDVVITRVADKILNGTLNIKEQTHLKITQPNTDIEESIRKQKVKEASKRKQELLDKINEVDYNIENLQRNKKVDSKSKAQSLRQLWAWDEDENAEERHNFMQKMSNLRKERQIKKKAMLQKMKQDQQDKEDQEKAVRQKLMEERLQQRTEQLAMTRARNKERTLAREELQAKTQQLYKQVKSKTQTYHKIEEKYAQKRILPELNRRKRELAQRREFNKLDLEQIDEHAKVYEAQQMAQEVARKEKQQKWIDDMKDHEAKNSNHYKSKTAVIDKQQPPKSPGYYEKEKEQYRHEKRIRYATLANELHKPQIDPGKRLEVISKQMESPNTRLQVITKVTESPISKPKFLRKSSTVANYQVQPVIAQNKRRKLVTNSITPKSEIVLRRRSDRTASSVKTDYLAEMRAKRENVLSQGNTPLYINPSYDRIIADNKLSELDRLNKIKSQSEKIDALVRKNDLLYQGKSDHNALEASGKVANLYIDTIKAKLAMLAKINS